MSDRIAGVYAAVSQQMLADAAIGATAAEVAYMGTLTAAAWWWRRGGRDSDADGAVIALVSDLAAADPITTAAALELGEAGQGRVAVWMDRHFEDIAARAESLLESAGGVPAAPVVELLGLHPDQVECAVTHRRSAQLIALDTGACTVADAVICGAVAEAKMLHELAGSRAGDPLELAQLMLVDPLVATAVWERGAGRCLYLWRWISGEWPAVANWAATMNSIVLWEKEVMG
ncbi:hypothetical protein H7J08_00970 [Mycobacterium frederiksbergense]|uniref:hypothetical protein n=1 Tax=Mycolicibacterium frederiksbergense TaxID=117567 RepID=UPI0021F2631B|nr:hypothetical protein [Mycolicibacterium frederiksbergense]MCV7043249.1 hypothetical protein [Mycolicibacterium frederiksbergense]